MILKNISNQKFGRLLAIERVGAPSSTKSKEAFWRCKCDCGNETVVSGYMLRIGHTKSCGCYNKELLSERSKGNQYTKTHGLSSSRIYKIYYAMKDRCYNSNKWNYNRYGGRGITMCDEWKDDFKSFYDWAMSNGYDETKSIDRIDPDGNYEPSNCRWTDNTTQQFNRHIQSNNTTGYKGVSKTKAGTFRAYIKKSGRQIPLGTFKTIEEAIYARQEAEKQYITKKEVT